MSAPPSPSGRRWVVQALGSDDRPIADARHEVAEAPEDTTVWDVRPLVDRGFMMAWTTWSGAGKQLVALPLASDGAPSSPAVPIARSGDDVVAVKIMPLARQGDAGDSRSALAIVTYGERPALRTGNGATGTLYAVGLDERARPTSIAPVRVADHLSAWQLTPAGRFVVAAYVQRGLPATPTGATVGKGGPKHASTVALPVTPALTATPRSAKVSLLSPTAKGLSVSDPVVLTADTALPEIDVTLVAPGRALATWEDRRELEAQIFAAPLDVSGGKPKLLAEGRRASTPRGDRSIVSLATTSEGAVMLSEITSPRPIRESRRRFELARLSRGGEPAGTPRTFWYPYDEGEPEMAIAATTTPATTATTPMTASEGEDIALLTYGVECRAPANGDKNKGDRRHEHDKPVMSCNPKDIRPFVVRFGGPSLAVRQADLLDVGDVVGGTALHAFDLACAGSRCDALVEGPTTPATVGMARVDRRYRGLEHGSTEPSGPTWAYAEAIDTVAPPRLESAATLGRESQFAGLRAARTNGGAVVGWITYAPDDAETSAPPGDKKKSKVKAKTVALGPGTARVALRVVDAVGEPAGPVSIVSERALSKGDVAVAMSAKAPAIAPTTARAESVAAGEGTKKSSREAAKPSREGRDVRETVAGVVAYVSRAEGDEEVYVSRVDALGKRIGGSSRITSSRGSASDVALVGLTEGGYLLAWVDGRKGGPAVYAVRLDRSGQKVGNEVKIGGGVAGDVADLALALLAGPGETPRVLAVWSDARDDATTGFADVYAAIVSPKDLARPIAGEHAIAKTKLHSHNPVVAPRPDGGALVAWLEDDPNASDMLDLTGHAGWGAVVARLDDAGAVAHGPAPLAVDPSVGNGKGVVTGVGAECLTSSGSASAASVACRVTLSWSANDGVAILATSLNAEGSGPPAKSVWSYRGAPTQEVAPSLVGATVFVCEDGLEKDDGRVRRLSIAW